MKENAFCLLIRGPNVSLEEMTEVATGLGFYDFPTEIVDTTRDELTLPHENDIRGIIVAGEPDVSVEMLTSFYLTKPCLVVGKPTSDECPVHHAVFVGSLDAAIDGMYAEIVASQVELELTPLPLGLTPVRDIERAQARAA